MSVLTPTMYRQYAGLQPTDPPTDAEIQQALNRYEVLVGSYIGRPLAPARYTERYYFTNRSPLITAHWPILTLHSISRGGTAIDPAKVLVHHSNGMIYHHGLFIGQEVTIEYDGGFNPLPEDIALVVFTLAEALLGGQGGGAAALAQAPVKTETVYGVSSITYDTSLLVKDQDSGSGTAGRFPELGPYAVVLDRYRGQYRYV